MTYRKLMMNIMQWGGIVLGGLAVLLFVIIPGVVGLWAKYDPSILNNPLFNSNINISWILWFFMGGAGLIVFAALSPFVVEFFMNFGIKGRLRKIGQKASATVISLEDTGVTMNQSPMVVVTVELPNHVKGSFNAFVSRVAFPTPGDKIEVVFNPDKPTEMLPAYKVFKNT